METSIASRYIHLSSDARFARAGNDEPLLRLGEASAKKSLFNSKPVHIVSMRTPLSDSESERLLESLLNDQRMILVLSPYLAKLRATVRRAHLLDNSILGTHQQTARQLVQLLIQLSYQSQWLTAEQQKALKKSLAYLTEQFDQDIVVFQEVILSLTQILIQRHKNFQQNIHRVIEACESEQRLDQAKQKLLSTLESLFEQQVIPLLIVDLFKLGWSELLLSAFVSQGEASSIGRRALAIVRHLTMHFFGVLPEERKTYEFQQKIIHAIKNSLSVFHHQESKQADFFFSLNSYLFGPLEKKDHCISWSEFTSQVFPWVKKLRATPPQKEKPKQNQIVLPSGAWISYDALIEKQGAFKCIWQSLDEQNFVFVNRLGIKVLEKTAADFFADVQNKKARILTEKNCSTIDLGLDEVIRLTYSFSGDSISSSRLSATSIMDNCLLRVQPIVAIKDIPLDWSSQLKAGVPLAQVFPPLHYEILLGVRNDQGEIVSPLNFIQLAERDEQIQQVDRWVISQTFNWLAKHSEITSSPIAFSINLSGQSVNDASLLEFIFAEFKRTRIPHQMIGFEVTETSAVSNKDQAEDFIQEMKRIGCPFSLDDFGTGLSSYSYLKSFAVDKLKIDGIFVENIAFNPADYAMVKSITEMGHALNKKVVAEFVSSAGALEKLIEIGVDYVQGHFVGMPHLLEELIFEEKRS